jgi:pre-mRNA-splicing factor SYF1
LADLTESIGTFEDTKAVYEKILELRIATPAVVINFAHYLEENKYFEESFKAYEKGVAMFDFPYSLDIWLCYLTKFADRYV